MSTSKTYKLGLVEGHGGDGLVVVHQCRVELLQAAVGVDHLVLDEDASGPQHERDEQVNVDVVPGAVETPRGKGVQGTRGNNNSLEVGEGVSSG